MLGEHAAQLQLVLFSWQGNSSEHEHNSTRLQFMPTKFVQLSVCHLLSEH